MMGRNFGGRVQRGRGSAGMCNVQSRIGQVYLWDISSKLWQAKRAGAGIVLSVLYPIEGEVEEGEEGG